MRPIPLLAILLGLLAVALVAVAPPARAVQPSEMLADPVLINRPIVVTVLGTRLCRPSEAVLDILPQPQRGAFSKEDGEPVVDAAGNRIA